jgi:hypothetical protein
VWGPSSSPPASFATASVGSVDPPHHEEVLAMWGTCVTTAANCLLLNTGNAKILCRLAMQLEINLRFEESKMYRSASTVLL